MMFVQNNPFTRCCLYCTHWFLSYQLDPESFCTIDSWISERKKEPWQQHVLLAESKRSFNQNIVQLATLCDINSQFHSQGLPDFPLKKGSLITKASLSLENLNYLHLSRQREWKARLSHEIGTFLSLLLQTIGQRHDLKRQLADRVVIVLAFGILLRY